MRLLPLLLLAGLSLPSLAQDPVTVLAPDKFAAEPAVITRVADVVAMQPDGTGYRERTFAVRIQSEAAVHDFSVISFQFAGASEHVDLHYLRVRRADGTTVETPASDMQEQPTAVTREAPFYSDQKEKQIPVRSLRVGDTLEWQVRIVRTKAEAPHEFWGEEGFSTTLVTLDETDELRVPKGSPVHVWTNPDETKPEESDTATDHVYLWRHHNLKPTTGPVAEIEKADAKKHYLTPEEEVDAREGKLPSIAWSTFPTWGAVGAWYRGLEHDRHTPDADIKAKVAELTAGKTTQEEKVRAVYDYVALQVRYVGVAFGIGRYQPHQASEVLSNQYGDCKDKHTLLAAMLDELGLHPDAVLIGEGVRFNEALPSPGAFNHLITQVAVDGTPVWLDATAETAPYRLLLYPIRDKQALVIPDEGMAHLERTPKDPPFAPFEKMTAVGTLNKDGVSESHIVITLHGDEEVYVRTILRQLPSGKYDAFVQALAANMGYGGTATHGSFTNLSDTTTPLSISFDYHREKAGDWDNYRIIPQLLPVGLGPVDEKDPPHRSIPLGMLTSNTSNAEMKLPDGWSAELPEAVHEKTDFATYDETYRLDKGTLYTERKITVLAERIPAKDWNQYKVWGDKVNLSGELYVQLTHTGAGMVIPLKGRSATAAPAPATTAEAKRLVRSALDSYNTGDYKAAGKSLDQAKSLDAGATGLWAGYGLVASAYGKSNEAIDDYRKELALHPDSTWVYSNIVRNQVRQARPDDAIATLHAWIAAEPYDPKPVITLMNQLMEAGQPDEAVAAGKAALSRMPEASAKDEGLQLQYGHAELKAGQDAAGVATLTALITNTSAPGTMNDAAYYLAESGKALPLADTTQRDALKRMAGESATWTLDEKPATLLQKTSLIVSAWDTMGYILLREGKLEEARTYLQAAWDNGQRPVVGEHLGDVRAALGTPDTAKAAYDEALATLPNGKIPATVAQRKLLEDKVAALKKAGAHNVAEPNQTEMRTVHLGAAHGSNGAAEYRLLLSRTGTLRAEPAGEKTVPDAQSLLKALKLPGYFPSGPETRLVKMAILNCHADTCDVIFEP